MKSISFISLACFQVIISFSTANFASAVTSAPKVVTKTGKLVGVNDGAGGTFSIDTLELR